MTVRARLKQLLIRSGGRLSPGLLVHLDSALTHLELGRWFADHDLSLRGVPQFPSRWALYAALAAGHRDARVLYVELGVYEGASMRMWSQLLRHPHASLHGFDSFLGLPAAWNASPAGTYSAQGVIPVFDDARVVLHRGWFHETLPGFVLPEHEFLIINFDADIYSSTVYGLDLLQHAIRQGTILIFDEFNDRNHEFKAFREFMDAHREMSFRIIGGSWNGVFHCAFERVA